MTEIIESTIGTTFNDNRPIPEAYLATLDQNQADTPAGTRPTMIIIDDVMVDNRAEATATVPPIPTTEVTVVQEGDPITPTAIPLERPEAAPEDGSQAATALTAPEAAEAAAPGGALVVNESNLLDLIEKRLARLGGQDSDTVKAQVVDRLVARAAADLNLPSAICDRLRNSTTFQSLMANRLRDYLTGGGGSNAINRAVRERLNTYNISDQVHREVRRHLERSSECANRASNTIKSQIDARLNDIRNTLASSQEAPKVLAEAITPILDERIDHALSQHEPAIERLIQEIERFDRYRASLGLDGATIEFQCTGGRNNRSNRLIEIVNPPSANSNWRENSHTADTIRSLVGWATDDDFIFYGGNKISLNHFSYLIDAPTKRYTPSTGDYGNNEWVALQIVEETFQALPAAMVPRGPWTHDAMAMHIEQKTNLGRLLLSMAYRVHNVTGPKRSIVRCKDHCATPVRFDWDTVSSFA